jgi:hypothetical protein
MSALTNKFSAFVGLDWANSKHDVCVQLGHDGKRTFEIISHTPEDLDEWLTKLHHQANKSLPGTGPCLAPRILAALGDDRSRFTSAQEIQNYAGLSPVTERSGQKCWVHWRWQCSKFIRQSFIEWSAKSVGVSYWAGLYYNQQRAKGKSHQSAVRALAFKWVRIVFRCWKTKVPYDESKYLKALKERNSPLLAA